jgi:hypothetical protein
MCGGWLGKTLGLAPSSPAAPAPTPEAPKTSDKAVQDAVQNVRKDGEGPEQTREGTMLTGAQGISVGMEKLQKKKLLGTRSPLGGS